jgi:uncharacterized glyoxalase superfamily metalloenzyme YdcJ
MSTHISPDDIRTMFSRAMSDMYRAEVPQYGALLRLVADVNDEALQRDPDLKRSFNAKGEFERLSLERHGAIRLGTAEELHAIAHLFAVMGMLPVGYYDLSVADVPVHSTAFRPIDEAALARNPFRVFTSLLRLEMIEDEGLRAQVAKILAARKILTPRASELIEVFERQGGLTAELAEEFVREALETFRWHSEAMVSVKTYADLCDAHRLIADVVSFKGPHINHLTPRTLDIDAAQARMRQRGLIPKASIEGPPRRNCPILLRQTSFLALEEPVGFTDDRGGTQAGMHKARFGEIEQRGAALTPKGRKIYDNLHASTAANAPDHANELNQRFQALPDDWSALHTEKLAYFRYSATEEGVEAGRSKTLPCSIEALIGRKYLRFDPIIYEDFLPVSAAGIFRSNLGVDASRIYAGCANRDMFEAALGRPVLDEFDLYVQAEKASLQAALGDLGVSIAG